MASSLFETMAVALVEGPEETGAGTVPDGHQEREQFQPMQINPPHLSLVKADPNTFYSDTAFFDKPSLRPTRATCSLGVQCGHSQALIICLSCAKFEGDCGYYCKDCFEAYHPWYRVAHKWSQLENFHDIDEEIDRQAYRASVERNVADLQGLLQIASFWGCELDTQDKDTKADDLIKEAARHATRVDVKIRDLADMTCEDRTKVSKGAVEGIICEAVRFQKIYEAKELADGEVGSGGVRARTSLRHPLPG